MPERSIQTYLQFRGQKLAGPTDNLIMAFKLYQEDGYLTIMDKQVVKHKDFNSTIRLDQEELITRVATKGLEINTLMSKYDLIRMLLLSREHLVEWLKFYAGKGRPAEVAKLLLLGHKIFTTADYNHAMVRAAFEGHKTIVQMLLDSGANDYNRGMANATGGGHEEIVEMMLARGANNYDETMYSAASGGYQKIMERMLGIMTDKQIKPDYNRPLRSAAREGYLRIVIWMLEFGAIDYINAISLARRQGHTEIADYLQLRIDVIHGF